MPYIKKENREALDPFIDALSEKIEICDSGELNYVITRLAARFLINGGLNYDGINAVSGVLQKVAAEFDYRVTRPYEDNKIAENGDIPEYVELYDQIIEARRG